MFGCIGCLSLCACASVLNTPLDQAGGSCEVSPPSYAPACCKMVMLCLHHRQAAFLDCHVWMAPVPLPHMPKGPACTALRGFG